jgi:hypothetical protein
MGPVDVIVNPANFDPLVARKTTQTRLPLGAQVPAPP